MSRKNVLNVYVTTTDAIPIPIAAGKSAVIPLTSSFSTIATSTQYLDNVSYQIIITTSDSTGTFSLQCSSDGTNFDTVGTAAVAAGANDTATLWVNQEYCSPYVRLHYTSTVAGTGSCTVLLTAKQIGG